MVTLHDIMTVDVVTVAPEDTLREVAEVLSSEHISGVPVADGDAVVGVISASDIVEIASSAEAGDGSLRGERQLDFEDQPGAEPWADGEEPPSSYFVRLWQQQEEETEAGRLGTPAGSDEDAAPLDRYTASDVMSRTLCALPPETPARDAAEYMLRAGIHRLLVVDGDALVGVATTTDLMKAVSQYGLAG